MSAWKHVALFAGGTLFGSAGFDLLSSDAAKTGYTHVIAGALRCKEDIQTNAANVKENDNDMVSDAKELNEELAEKKAAKAAAKAAKKKEYEDVTDEAPEEEAPKASAKEPAARKTAARKTSAKK